MEGEEVEGEDEDEEDSVGWGGGLFGNPLESAWHHLAIKPIGEWI